MRVLTTILKRLLHPPRWVALTVTPPVFAALAWVFLTGRNNSTPAYLIYGMSAYCLTVWVLALPRLVKGGKAALTHRIRQTVFGNRYLDDRAFRGMVSLWVGMIVNFLYVVFRVAVGVRYASVWLISMAVYYLVLGALRLSLILGYRHKDRARELRCYRRTAWLLFLLNIPMGGMILLMVLTDSGYSYPGLVIYLSAAYTFYAVITSVIQLVRFRRLGSPILSASRVLHLIAALMSVLGLQTAMIAEFGGKGEGFRRMMNALTGGAVWLSVILIAVLMLYRSRKLREEGSADEPI